MDTRSIYDFRFNQQFRRNFFLNWLPFYSTEEILCPQEGEHTEVFKVDLAKCVEFLKERTKCGDIVDSRVWSLFTGLSLGLEK